MIYFVPMPKTGRANQFKPLGIAILLSFVHAYSLHKSRRICMEHATKAV